MGLTHIKNIMPKLNIPPLSRACLTVDKRNTREKVGDDDRRSHGFHTHTELQESFQSAPLHWREICEVMEHSEDSGAVSWSQWGADECQRRPAFSVSRPQTCGKASVEETEGVDICQLGCGFSPHRLPVVWGRRVHNPQRSDRTSIAGAFCLGRPPLKNWDEKIIDRTKI